MTTRSPEVDDVISLAAGVSNLGHDMAMSGFHVERYSIEVRTLEQPHRRYRVRQVPVAGQPETWELQFTPLDQNGVPTS